MSWCLWIPLPPVSSDGSGSVDAAGHLNVSFGVKTGTWSLMGLTLNCIKSCGLVPLSLPCRHVVHNLQIGLRIFIYLQELFDRKWKVFASFNLKGQMKLKLVFHNKSVEDGQTTGSSEAQKMSVHHYFAGNVLHLYLKFYSNHPLI